MLEFVILAAMAVAGYEGGSAWLALAGAAAMTVGSWWRKVALLRQHPNVPDRKSTRLNSSHIQKSRMPSSA